MNRQPPVLTVYSRAYCHLCDDMIEALRTLQADHSFELNVVDVDSEPALEASYGELVPVLA
ncbi:MAG: glutaredoxin family protein, partial [Burkholderiales bacterium]